MVATNADLMHSYRDLLGGHPRGTKVAKGLARKRWSPSLFVVHFGVKGEYPDIAHHSILFGPRYKGLLDDIYGGTVPDDFSLYLHHPSVTDPRSEEHTSELQSLMRISYAVFCLKKKNN